MKKDGIFDLEKGSVEEGLLRKIKLDSLPRHIAIIMDGNGRWARRRLLPRVSGHRAGIKSVRETVETCARLKIENLTLYAFSIENWKRPKEEVDTLMALLKEYLEKELKTLMDNNIVFRVIGRMSDLYPSVVTELEKVIRTTSRNDGMIFNLALSYSGRAEIIDACRKIIETVKVKGEIPDLDEEYFSGCLYTSGLPDPDLLIRTSGELRISNFLLWQIAYSEIWVTDALWPDFRKRDLFQAIVDYQGRERRYGRITAVGKTSR